ncbi:MAG: glycosyltransferase family 9 protein [Kiritimatiellia bacterium]
MRALVVKLSSLGDLFSAMPAVQLVRRHTGAVLEWVTQPEYVSLVRRVRGVERVIAYPRRDFFTAWPAFRRDLRSTPHDLVLDFQGLLKSALVCRLAGGARLIAPSFSREGSSQPVSAREGRARPRRPRHAVDSCLDTVRHLRRWPTGWSGAIDFPDGTPAPPRTSPSPPPFPGGPPRTGRWSASAPGCVLLRGNLRHPAPWAASLTAPPAKPSSRELGPRVFNHAGATDLPRTGGLLARMDLLVTNDSGPMHMACAAGTRVLALFGPTDARRTGPYGDRHTVLQSPRFTPADADSSAYKSGDLKWMSAIDPADVLRTALTMISRA